MALKYIRQDLVDQKGILIHGCNAQGVMGSGVAKDIKKAFPEAYMKYLVERETNGLYLGTYTFVEFWNGVTVVNLISQMFYGRDGQKYVDYEAIRKGLTEIKKQWPNGKFFLPKIGCGLGGGDWEIVSKIIEETLGNATICVKE